jgi:hypothetical protein
MAFLLMHFTSHWNQELAARYLDLERHGIALIGSFKQKFMQLRSLCLCMLKCHVVSDAFCIDYNTSDTQLGGDISLAEKYVFSAIEYYRNRAIGHSEATDIARDEAVLAYAAMREEGEPALFGDAKYIAMIASGIELYSWTDAHVIASLRTRTATPFLNAGLRKFFLLLVSDVLPYHRFVASHRRDEVPSRPEVLTHEVALSLSVHPRKVDCALAFDKAHHLRHRVLRWDRQHHVHVIGHQMPLFNPAFLLRGQLSEYLTQVFA